MRHPHSATARGFTLIELMVVMLIIGVMTAGALLSFRLAQDDGELEKERDRILALTDYLREQAALQNREYGMRCFEGGYEFLMFDIRQRLWLRDTTDSMLRPRRLPKGLAQELSVEGRRIVLPKEDQPADEIAPQILLYSSGELSLFELTIRREPVGQGVRFAPATDSDRIEVTALAASPR